MPEDAHVKDSCVLRNISSYLAIINSDGGCNSEDLCRDHLAKAAIDAAMQPEQAKEQGTDHCCENGTFAAPHDCMKKPGGNG